MASEMVTPPVEAIDEIRWAQDEFQSVVFTRNCGVSDEPQMGAGLVGVVVGESKSAEEAWSAAKDAAQAGNTFGYTILAKHDSGKETAADAEKIVEAARGWVRENVPSEQVEILAEIFDALSQTLSRGWTEVDEALSRLSLVQRSIRDDAVAQDHFGVAVGMLQRWQGRNGRIGNAEPTGGA